MTDDMVGIGLYWLQYEGNDVLTLFTALPTGLVLDDLDDFLDRAR